MQRKEEQLLKNTARKTKRLEVFVLRNILGTELLEFADRLEMWGKGGIKMTSRALIPGYIFDPFTEFEKVGQRISQR